MSSVSTGEIQVILGTLLFGFQAVLCRAAMTLGIGPFTFNALVMILGVTFLSLVRKPLKKISDKVTNGTNETEEEVYVSEPKPIYFAESIRSILPCSLACSDDTLELAVWSVLSGFVMFSAKTCTQVGIVTVTATMSGFLTALYVVFTPLILAIIQVLFGYSNLGTVNQATYVAAWISLLGSYILVSGQSNDGTIDTHLVVSFGELITVLGSFAWAMSIVVCDLGVAHVNCIELTYFGSVVAAVLCVITAIVLEHELMINCFHSLGYSGWALCFIVGVLEVSAYALNLLGQMDTTGSRAALLMSLDSVVTAFAAHFLLGEQLTELQSVGCLIMLTSTLVSSSQEKIHVHDETGQTTLTLQGGRYFISEWRPRQRPVMRSRSLSFTYLNEPEHTTDEVIQVLTHDLGLSLSEATPLLEKRDELIRNYSESTILTPPPEPVEESSVL